MPELMRTKINAARLRWRTLDIAVGLLFAAAILVGMALLSFWSDRAMAFSTTGRMWWLSAFVVVLVFSALIGILRPLRKPLPDEVVAQAVERKYPALNERLLSSLSFAGAGSVGSVSPAFIKTLLNDTESMCASLNFPGAIPVDRLRKPSAIGLISLVVLTAHVLLMPAAWNAWLQRILYPNADIPVYSYTRVWVTPADFVAPRGSEVQVGIRTSGKTVDQAILYYRFGNGSWNQARVRSADTKGDVVKFSYAVPDVQKDMTFYAKAGDGQANPHTVKVEDRPALIGVHLKLEYPAYTGRKAEGLDAGNGNVAAPVGTHVLMKATFNKPLASAILGGPNSPQTSWDISGATAAGSLDIRKDASYELRLKDQRGFTCQAPPQFTIRAQQDEVPRVTIEKPGTELERTPFGNVGLKVNASDDYSVQDIRIEWHNAGKSGGFGLPIQPAKLVATGGVWNLASIGLKAGDTMSYEALARDNDDVSGPHTGRSAKFTVKIVSAQEMRERLDAQKNQEFEALKDLLKKQTVSIKQLDAAKQDANPETRKQAEQKERNLAGESASLAQRMNQTNQEMKDNNLGGKAELKRREEAAADLNKLAAKDMPQAASLVEKNNLAEAHQEERAIEKNLQKLANAAAPAKTPEQLAAQAEKIADAQQRLADKSSQIEAQRKGRQDAQLNEGEKAAAKHLAEQQKQVQAETQNLQKSLQNAADDAKDQNSPDAKALEQAAQKLAKSGVSQKQSSAAAELQKEQPGQAASKQNQAAQDLRSLTDQLDQSQQNKSGQDPAARARQLEAAAEKLQQLAIQQGRLATQTKDQNSPDGFRKLAETEKKAQAEARNAASQIQNNPDIQKNVERAAENEAQAAESLDKGEARPAETSARDASRKLYQSAMALRQAAQALRRVEEANQAAEQVKQLAAEQRALKNETKALDSSRTTPELNGEQQKAAQKLETGQYKLGEKAKNMANDMTSNSFRWALTEAARRMERAGAQLNHRNTGAEAQRQQDNAAQILDRIGRALKQEAQAQEQQADQAGQQQNAKQDQAEASPDLQLARELQSQIRQETGNLNERRNRNAEKRLSAEQQRELDQLTQEQREVQQIARDAGKQLKSSPELKSQVDKAADLMEDAHDQLGQKKETGDPAQTKMDQAVGTLDKVIAQAKEQMRQQKQQMAQKQKGKPGPGEQKMAQNQKGDQPQKQFAPVQQAQPSAFNKYDPRARKFTGLDPRAMQSMREGQQEKVSAEFREAVKQYFKAVAERSR